MQERNTPSSDALVKLSFVDGFVCVNGNALLTRINGQNVEKETRAVTAFKNVIKLIETAESAKSTYIISCRSVQEEGMQGGGEDQKPVRRIPLQKGEVHQGKKKCCLCKCFLLGENEIEYCATHDHHPSRQSGYFVGNHCVWCIIDLFRSHRRCKTTNCFCHGAPLPDARGCKHASACFEGDKATCESCLDARKTQRAAADAAEKEGTKRKRGADASAGASAAPPKTLRSSRIRGEKSVRKLVKEVKSSNESLLKDTCVRRAYSLAFFHFKKPAQVNDDVYEQVCTYMIKHYNNDPDRCDVPILAKKDLAFHFNLFRKTDYEAERLKKGMASAENRGGDTHEQGEGSVQLSALSSSSTPAAASMHDLSQQQQRLYTQNFCQTGECGCCEYCTQKKQLASVDYSPEMEDMD